MVQPRAVEAELQRQLYVPHKIILGARCIHAFGIIPLIQNETLKYRFSVQ